MSTAIVWFRRDLRLHDNPALMQAAQHHERIIPLYIHAPQEEGNWAPGAASRWWLHHSLAGLDTALRGSGSRLILRSGSCLEILRNLVTQTDADAVYWNRLYEPAVIARDRTIKATLKDLGLVRVESFNGALLWEPWTIKNGNNEPYRVFTPYWKACVRLPLAPPLSAPDRLPLYPEIDSLPLQELGLMPAIAWHQGLANTWQPGEWAALEQLTTFCSNVLMDYPNGRNRPDQAGVSHLSPRLHFGELSPRQVWQAVLNECDGSPLSNPAGETYLRELGWREFAHQVLFHWPHTPEQPLQERFAAYPWRTGYAGLLKAWQQGRTGIPLVDAGMRQLWNSGWMHNRVRMIVASFLTKNCRIPWQEGAHWFWDTLVDADLANNSMGWQWTAGCGVDAAPYYRVFNPVRQGQQFDPDGHYVRRWVPELADVPTRWIHQPWTLSEQEQKKWLKSAYPRPIVDLTQSRSEALAGYQTVKGIP